MIQSNSTLTGNIDVIGIGNAIVDILVNVEDTFLEKYSLIKGSMTLINQTQAQNFYAEINEGLQASGGSAANTITGISQLGGIAGFIGKVGNDELGISFKKDIEKVGAIYNTPSAEDGPSTARCMIFVTPDAQRTMCTYLGVSVLIKTTELDLGLIENSKIIYLEGYLWDDQSAKEAFIEAAKISKNSGGKVALSLSDSFCVSRHRESFKELIDEYIDILFANEDEIISLYQTICLDDSLEILKDKCNISVITLGEKGSIILDKGILRKIPCFKLGNTIDTTGAGDMYAAGFLYGYTQDKDIISCGEIGSLCAAHVVTHLGPRAKISLKDLVRIVIQK